MSGHICQMDRGQISWVTSASYEYIHVYVIYIYIYWYGIYIYMVFVIIVYDMICCILYYMLFCCINMMYVYIYIHIQFWFLLRASKMIGKISLCIPATCFLYLSYFEFTIWVKIERRLWGHWTSGICCIRAISWWCGGCWSMQANKKIQKKIKKV